ncbi:hypothetical protein CORC01_07826 [Colletotrichum orchidophilum]|uniref:Uncharacterized protein n=1 Tax=Colletotrichum orchidophilum TaxID=1209926 RepID=A0A1G4B5Y8_9PEZI|nr:uncharacterized protein CORC01_07826 [Colletotrichum orchidophilum]OHE96859.1 hypothetical protein CORC01_07826 [Colletotrichum orchidophilum]
MPPAPIRDATGETCYNPWLEAFNDGLDYAGSPPQSMSLVVLEFNDRSPSLDTQKVRKSWLKREDTWNLPSVQEMNPLGNPEKSTALWIGWFLPTVIWDSDDRRFTINECVQNCGTSPIKHDLVKKDFKVVYKLGSKFQPKLFALYDPDENGLCRARVVLHGVDNIFFFKEWRDDTLCGRSLRQRFWLQKVKAGALRACLLEHSALRSPVQRHRQVSESWSEENDEESSDSGQSTRTISHFDSSSDSDPSTDEEDSVGIDLGTRDHQIGWSHDREENDLASNTSEHSSIESPRTRIITLRVPQRNGPFIPASPLRQDSGSINLLRNSIPASSPTLGRRNKRQADQQSESESGPTQKRHQPLRTGEASVDQPKSIESDIGIHIKREVMDKSDDDVQFVKVVPVTRGQEDSHAEHSTNRVPLNNSVVFVAEFLAAGKLPQLARLPDVFSREVMLETFREHLTSTDMSDFDALVKNIVFSADESVRVMLAETLGEKLRKRLPAVSDDCSIRS